MLKIKLNYTWFAFSKSTNQLIKNFSNLFHLPYVGVAYFASANSSLAIFNFELWRINYIFEKDFMCMNKFLTVFFLTSLITIQAQSSEKINQRSVRNFGYGFQLLGPTLGASFYLDYFI